MFKSYRLSKSKYLSGLQCHKRLWLEIHSPELIPPTPPTQERIFSQGTYVGELARERFPGGILIDTDYDKISEAFDLTKEALENGTSTIFEGVFSFDNVLVRPDVIKQDENNDWELIEVKSSTSVKEENNTILS